MTPLRALSGPILTIALAGLCELVLDTPLYISNPPALLMLAIVWSGFSGGPLSSFLSAAIACAYTAYFFADPGFHFTEENFRRVVIWAVTMPFTGYLVGRLNRRAAAALVQVELGAFREAQLQEQALVITELRRTEGELRRSEEELRESQERLRLAVQAAGLGPWDWDLRTNVVVFSPEWKRQLGYDDNEISDRYEEWESRLHPDDRERVLRELQEYVWGKRPEYAVEFRLRHKDGSYRWIFTRGVALRDASGNPLRVLGCHLDVTAARRLEEQFHQAQKMEAVGRLAGGVAHDFNNLLTIILGYSDMAFESLRADEPTRELITEIQQAAARAAVLTRQLLAFSRKQRLEPQVVDLNALLKELVKLLTRLIGEDITLTLEPDPTLGFVNVDATQFEQAVMNLVINARDAMPAGGHLRIETRRVEIDEDAVVGHPDIAPGAYALVTVTDTGSGMSESVKSRVFEPFFTTKELGKGTGLGLAMVYGFVTQSGGHIEVESEVDRGTTFKLYLPFAADEAIRATGATAEPLTSPRGTETILLVEDEDSVRELSRLVLRSSGYTVLEARDGEQGALVAQLHTGEIHLLITDLVMPRMGGRQLAQLLSRARPGIRTLFISGYIDDASAAQAGGNFLQKPFTPLSLARKVREALDASKGEAQE